MKELHTRTRINKNSMQNYFLCGLAGLKCLPQKKMTSHINWEVIESEPQRASLGLVPAELIIKFKDMYLNLDVKETWQET